MLTANDDDLFGDDPDRTVLAHIHDAAHERFGGGVRRVLLLDLGPRLDLVRAVLRLRPSVWDDQTLGQIMFGGTEGRASARVSKIKSGTLRMDVGVASMLAALVNYILCVQPVCELEVSIAQRRDVLEWTLDATQQPAKAELLHARDVMGDLLTFAQRMVALAEAHRPHPDGLPTLADAHAAILEYLTTPIDFAVRDQRLVIERARQRAPQAQRFGSAQRPGAHPRHWEPVRLDPGDSVDMGLPRRARSASRGWLVTVRDAVRAPATRRDDDWVWRQGWENTVRWFPGAFTFAPEDDIAVPSVAHGDIVAMPGHYQVFLFVEPEASTAMAQLLASPGDPQALGPDEDGYRRLVNGLRALVEDEGVRIHTASYLVEA